MVTDIDLDIFLKIRTTLSKSELIELLTLDELSYIKIDYTEDLGDNLRLYHILLDRKIDDDNANTSITIPIEDIYTITRHDSIKSFTVDVSYYRS